MGTTQQLSKRKGGLLVEAVSWDSGDLWASVLPSVKREEESSVCLAYFDSQLFGVGSVAHCARTAPSTRRPCSQLGPLSSTRNTNDRHQTRGPRSPVSWAQQ